jgi:POT family proton-dependent oligopeptide transporter
VAVKMAGGIALAGLAFLVMAEAAHLARHGPVAPYWLVVAFALLSAGELALAPVGLSVTVAVAPEAFTSQMMGLWWLSAALGAGAGSQLVRLAVVLPTDRYYLIFGLLSFCIAGALAAARARLAGLLVATPDPIRAAPLDAPVPG